MIQIVNCKLDNSEQVNEKFAQIRRTIRELQLMKNLQISFKKIMNFGNLIGRSSTIVEQIKNQA